MPVDTVQWRGEIGTFNNLKNIYFYIGPFCLLSALIYIFVSSLLQILSIVHFTVNLICFTINSRLFVCYNKKPVNSLTFLSVLMLTCEPEEISHQLLHILSFYTKRNETISNKTYSSS